MTTKDGKPVQRVVVYGRVSTFDQNAEVQLAELRRYAATRGWTVVHEYVDNGISGTQRQRPQLNAMLDAANRGTVDFDAVLCWRFDRISRSVRDLLEILGKLESAGVAFVSMNEAVDTSTSTGRFMLNILGSVAQLERDIISERTKAGLRSNRPGFSARGKRLGRPESTTPSRTTLWRRRKHQNASA